MQEESINVKEVKTGDRTYQTVIGETLRFYTEPDDYAIAQFVRASKHVMEPAHELEPMPMAAIVTAIYEDSPGVIDVIVFPPLSGPVTRGRVNPDDIDKETGKHTGGWSL